VQKITHYHNKLHWNFKAMHCILHLQPYILGPTQIHDQIYFQTSLCSIIEDAMCGCETVCQYFAGELNPNCWTGSWTLIITITGLL